MSRLRFLLEIDDETVEMTTDYQDFMRRVRRRLGIRFSHNVPALTVQAEPPPGFCDVVIETNERSVRFRLRVDNLYLIGYQMLGGAWFEFGRTDGVHLINGSTYLEFDCSYASMRTAADQTMRQTSIGLPPLETAVETLAVEERTRERARSMMVVVMVICEALRFIPMSQLFTSPDTELRIQDYMMDMVHSWGFFSGALFRADAYPEERFMLPDEYHLVIPPNRRIQTLADVISILGVVLGLCYDRPRISLRLTVLNNEQGQCFVGVPLLEVFSVSVNYITSASSANLTGTIIITNGPYNLSIYNRTKNNPELISPYTDIDLNGPPSQPLSAFSVISIILRLLLNNDTDAFIGTTISLDPFNIGTKYDERITVPLDSPKGSVAVNCAVLRNAVCATVTVTLLQAYESTSEVYGHIYVYYEGWQDPLARSTLFRKRAPDYVSVDRGRNIPLSRSAVAVPLSARSLRVTANLRDYDTVSSDDVIVNQTFAFSIPDTLPFTLYRDSTEEGGNVVRVIVSWTTGY